MEIWLIIVGIGIFLLFYSLNKQNKEFTNNKT